MNVLVACKIVDDDQDVKVDDMGTLDFSCAHKVISAYDKNAIEAATRIKGDGSLKAITVSPAKAADAKVQKDILARGVDELIQAASDSCEDLDALATAAELAKLAAQTGEWDVIVTGDGSADLYAKQVGVQLATRLGLPYVNGVIDASGDDTGSNITAKRLLEKSVENVIIPTPCVISVTPDFASARICGMKDILSAGKKPKVVSTPEDVEACATETVSIQAPPRMNRKQQIFDDVAELASAIKAEL